MSPGDATHQIKSGQVLVAEFAVGARPPVAVLSEILEDETTIDEVIEQLPLCPITASNFTIQSLWDLFGERWVAPR